MSQDLSELIVKRLWKLSACDCVAVVNVLSREPYPTLEHNHDLQMNRYFFASGQSCTTILLTYLVYRARHTHSQMQLPHFWVYCYFCSVLCLCLKLSSLPCFQLFCHPVVCQICLLFDVDKVAWIQTVVNFSKKICCTDSCPSVSLLICLSGCLSVESIPRRAPAPLAQNTR